MTERVYYKTAFGDILAEGVVLKESHSVESMGVEGMLVECTGAAPFDEQPTEDEKRYDIFADYLAEGDEDTINMGMHIISPEDVVERF